MNNLCRKCRASLDQDEPEPVAAVTVPATEPTNGNGHGYLQIATAIRSLRHRIGLSQRQLALRMSVPRTYVSKIENEKATPTLSSLARLARALDVTVPDLINGGDNGNQNEVRDLLADDFIAQLVPFVVKLDAMQQASVISQVRDLTLRPRRHA
jgi:transcriptional regulator with XRE-family HTH domain